MFPTTIKTFIWHFADLPLVVSVRPVPRFVSLHRLHRCMVAETGNEGEAKLPSPSLYRYLCMRDFVVVLVMVVM